MKFGPVAESWLERLALALNLVPRPLVDTQVAFNSARAIMAATALGVFDALDAGPRTAEEVAAACATDPQATRALLGSLLALDYVAYRGGRYRNRPVAQKWLVRTSPVSVRDKLLFQQIEWDWMAGLEDFVRTGRARDMHANLTPGEWDAYQRAMRALSCAVAPEVARRLPLRAGATAMLDIGGSHGMYSVALCRRHPQLRSTILELEGAIERASAIAAAEGLGERVSYRAGDALTDDLGEAQYDLVHLSHVAHHFTAAQNVDLAHRVRRALKPGGLYVIGELERHDDPTAWDAVAATTHLYFALTSTSGTWSLPEIHGWMRAAGLDVGRAVRYAAFPGYVSQIATRPA